VYRFGTIGFQSLHGAFAGVKNLTFVPAVLPATVKDIGAAFYLALSFNGDITTWVVCAVLNMSAAFQQDSAINQNIGNWNTSAVTEMTYNCGRVKASNVS
jgi:surface protein